MKKLLGLAGLATVGLTVTACSRADLVIANWGFFMDADLISEFEEKHGVRIDVTTYNSNVQAIGLIETGTRFDIVIPSEYAVQELSERGFLQPIDWDKLNELDFSQDMFHTDLLEKLDSEEDRFNLLEYGVPYKWGQLGILYNTQIPNIRQMLEREQWNIFNYEPLATIIEDRTAQARYIGFYESAQDGFAVALSATGAADINSTDETELGKAAAWLNEMNERHGNRINFDGDGFHTSAPDGRYAVLQKFSGCATLIKQNSLDGVEYGFFVPEQTNLFVNSMVIPANSRNADLAHKFIAFISSPENAVINAMDTQYTPTVQAAFDHLTGVEGKDLDFTFDWNSWFINPAIQDKDAFGHFANNASFNSVVDNVSEGHVFYQFIPGRRTNLTTRWAQFRAQ